MKTLSKIAALSAFAIFAVSCNNSGNKTTSSVDSATGDVVTENTTGLQQFVSDTPQDSAKIFILKITKDVSTDSSHIYTVQNLYKKDTVGAQVEVIDFIPAGIVNGQVNEDVGFTKGKIKISGIGASSDQLIKSLGEVYGIPTSDAFEKNVILPNVFSSNTVNGDLSKKTKYDFKLFLDNKKGQPAELFFSLDTYGRNIVIGEKDKSFRVGFLSALTGK